MMVTSAGLVVFATPSMGEDEEQAMKIHKAVKESEVAIIFNESDADITESCFTEKVPIFHKTKVLLVIRPVAADAYNVVQERVSKRIESPFQKQQVMRASHLAFSISIIIEQRARDLRKKRFSFISKERSSVMKDITSTDTDNRLPFLLPTIFSLDQE